MNKIAVFYLIGQIGNNWKEIYNHQINLLEKCGLYNNIEFIDVYVVGKEQLPSVRDKFNNVTYLGYLEEEIPSNKKLYRADKTIFKNKKFGAAEENQILLISLLVSHSTIKLSQLIFNKVIYGARGGIRTRIVSNVQDFKSCAFHQFRHSGYFYSNTSFILL